LPGDVSSFGGLGVAPTEPVMSGKSNVCWDQDCFPAAGDSFPGEPAGLGGAIVPVIAVASLPSERLSNS
jgi:hypothetical protein